MPIRLFRLLILFMTTQPLSGAFRLIIVDPGHFHASLLQREMYSTLDPRVSVYARLGPELLDYLNRVSLFNARKDNPTHWDLDIHTGTDPMAAMLHDHPGDAVVFTGRNRGKIDRILASLGAGLHVFADKPWIISLSDLPKLEQALDLADRKSLIGYDIMTERYEVTSLLQRAFVNTPEVFGSFEKGSTGSPAIYAKSIHHVMKVVGGLPLRRSAWFFDIDEYGEALADVGTHVVDLVQWTAFPDSALDYHQDIEVLAGRHWPLSLTQAQFQQVTGETAFPASLAPHVHNGKLDYLCNNSVDYTLRGVHVKLEILWNWEAAPGTGDVYEASFHGTKARVELRQGKSENFIPEVYIVPAGPDQRAGVFAAVRDKVAALRKTWPGLDARESGSEMRLVIPDKYRVGHEAHFAQVATRFLEYMQSPKSIPAWERSNMVAKYFISTMGVELANR
ncbi:MAG: hypothetical protein LC126_24405 [Bryobacterales bacterium]|nr:hypothetical protein [Bryobacterales bacterium]